MHNRAAAGERKKKHAAGAISAHEDKPKKLIERHRARALTWDEAAAPNRTSIRRTNKVEQSPKGRRGGPRGRARRSWTAEACQLGRRERRPRGEAGTAAAPRSGPDGLHDMGQEDGPAGRPRPESRQACGRGTNTNSNIQEDKNTTRTPPNPSEFQYLQGRLFNSLLTSYT